MLETLYINEAVSRVHVSKWFKRIREEFEDLFEIHRSQKYVNWRPDGVI
jgi:hypothetical protein